MTQIWWFLTRSTGIVSWALLTASVLWGLSLSARTAKRPAWTTAMHRWVSGLSVILLVTHVGAVLIDPEFQVTLAETLVPFVTTWNPGAVALGILALYAMLAVELTSLAKNRLPARVWRAVHLTSFAGFWTATAHGVLLGTDTTNPLMFGLYSAAGLTVSALTIYRVLATRKARRTVTLPASPAPAPTPTSI